MTFSFAGMEWIVVCFAFIIVWQIVMLLALIYVIVLMHKTSQYINSTYVEVDEDDDTGGDNDDDDDDEDDDDEDDDGDDDDDDDDDDDHDDDDDGDDDVEAWHGTFLRELYNSRKRLREIMHPTLHVDDPR